MTKQQEEQERIYRIGGTGSPVLHLSGVVRTTVTDSAGNTGTVNVPVDFVWDA